MFKKSLLTISLLLPLAAISAAAHAGSTITDKSYWPNEATRTTSDLSVAQSDSRAAFASTATAPRFQIAPSASEGGGAPHYHGGPKFQ